MRSLALLAALALLSGVAHAQGGSPPPPGPPPPGAPPPKKDGGERGGDDRQQWRDSLADWMMWQRASNLSVGTMADDPMTTGFGNPDLVQPLDADLRGGTDAVSRRIVQPPP